MKQTKQRCDVSWYPPPNQIEPPGLYWYECAICHLSFRIWSISTETCIDRTWRYIKYNHNLKHKKIAIYSIIQLTQNCAIFYSNLQCWLCKECSANIEAVLHNFPSCAPEKSKHNGAPAGLLTSVWCVFTSQSH